MPPAYSDRPVLDTSAKTAKPAAELRDISVVYGTGAATVHAVNGVSLDIYRGEVLLLMGPSGSGKSTLLQVLGCIRYATAGSLHMNGVPVHGLPADDLSRLRRERMGFVFQHYNLLPSLRAWENVALALELRGARGRDMEETSRRALFNLGLKNRSDAYPEELSGGERQRVAIARAVVGDPDIILADEPTAALDAANGIAVARLLAKIAHEQGRAVVIVTHDARVSGIADRTVHLEDGTIRSIRKTVQSQNRFLEESGIHEMDNQNSGMEDRNPGGADSGARRRAAIAG
jgi:putative ABC transport system ATP-binding protein